MKTLIFDPLVKKFVLEAFNKVVDNEGYIAEKSNPKQRVLTQDGEDILFENFAGLRKGSEIFIKSDIISLINLCEQVNPQ